MPATRSATKRQHRREAFPVPDRFSPQAAVSQSTYRLSYLLTPPPYPTPVPQRSTCVSVISMFQRFNRFVPVTRSRTGVPALPELAFG